MIAGKEALKPGEAKNSWLTGTAAGILLPLPSGSRASGLIMMDWSSIRSFQPGGRALPRRLFRRVLFDITVERRGHDSMARLEVDGKPIDGTLVPLPPAGIKFVSVRVFLD